MNNDDSSKEYHPLSRAARVSIENHRIVGHDEWLSARAALLLKEKEFTRLRDDLSRQRRELPWEAVPKEYVFEGPNGKQTLSELFDGRSQLVIYHFMFGPDAKPEPTHWPDAGCEQCSFWADNFNGIVVHLNHRDVSMIAVSRAPYSKLAAYKKRMGWNFKWVSSGSNEFNFDYHVSFTTEEFAKKKAFYNYAIQDPSDTEREAISVFHKDSAGTVFHTYSAYARGIDMLNLAYHYLDIVPKGRDEGDRGPFWVRRHDEYDPA
jgi:predicted dithiol-disulfide oxidoreductase (DUF899 family)